MLKCIEHDDDLSIFANKDRLLFTCKHGHFYIVAPDEIGNSGDHAKPKTRGPRVDVADSERMILEEFGPEAVSAIAGRRA